MAIDAYRVIVANHFHYDDPDERWTAGIFATAPAALARARGIVDGCISDLARNGARGEALLRLYLSQGDDPFIVGSPDLKWSSLDYAKACVDQLDQEGLSQEPHRSTTDQGKEP